MLNRVRTDIRRFYECGCEWCRGVGGTGVMDRYEEFGLPVFFAHDSIADEAES